MKKYTTLLLAIFITFGQSLINFNGEARAASQAQPSIWDIDRSHIVKWTLWSFNSEFQLTTVDEQDERWIQTGFSGFAEGEYRRISHPKLGHVGFVAGSTYTSQMGLVCRNYVIRLEDSQDAFPAMACYQNNSWQYTRSVF
ncbi:hypothetical protein [Spartinivicinus ruber]|uniref:hypothetical protein n=1 Tax=Spartinivicinus ruber TaxID=2683272 RepID=UPI0013D4EC54|nr:hypothetical protein [Spartinivicinus ruber]